MITVMAKKEDKQFFDYKGVPFVRNGNTIYYGDPSESHIIMMQILDSKKVEDIDVATKVMVTLLSCDPNLSIQEKIIKKAEKDGLYSAMDIACIWLERAVAK